MGCAIRRHDNRPHRGFPLVQFVQHGQPVHHRHLDVEQHQLDVSLYDQHVSSEGLPRRLANFITRTIGVPENFASGNSVFSGENPLSFSIRPVVRGVPAL
jgi:hypothetical protein